MSGQKQDESRSPFAPHRCNTSFVPHRGDEHASGSKDGTSSARRMPGRSALSLYPSNTWSPISVEQSKSAGLPPKPAWDGFSNPCSNTKNQTFRLLPGLGISSSGSSFTRGAAGRIIGATTSSANPNCRYIQTEGYHNGGDEASVPSSDFPLVEAQTDPLAQNTFTITRDNITSSSSGSNSSYYALMSTPQSTVSTHGTYLGSDQGRHHEDKAQPLRSGLAAVINPDTTQNQIQTGVKAEVWGERQTSRGLRRSLKDPDADWDEAFPGALTTLGALNPEHFQMPYGTLVVNIKTDFQHNIVLSIQAGKYSVIEAVSKRLMDTWNTRQSERVLMLFSVSGGKGYAGLAEMSGRWDPAESIDDWEEKPDSEAKGKQCVGSFKVTWIYVKNVSYHHFSHIRQPSKGVNLGNPVGNMWTGMLFPLETGRQVVEQYVKTSATSSALGYPRNYVENAGLPSVQRASGSTFPQPRGTFNARSGRGGRGGVRGGHAFNVPPRSQVNPAGDRGSSEVSGSGDSTPTTATFNGGPGKDMRPPPKCNLPILDPTSISPGQLASVSVDHQGNMVLAPSPVTTDRGHSSQSTGAYSQGDTGRSVMARTLGFSPEHMADKALPKRSPLAQDGYNDPKDFFDANAKPRTLQQSASMYNMYPKSETPTSSTGRTILRSAASINNLGQHYTHIPVQQTAHMNEVRFHSGSCTTPNGASGFDFPSSAGETPTHRPAPHCARGTEHSKPDQACESIASSDETLSLDQLKARFHMLHAEKYFLQHQAQDSGQSAMDTRLLDAKMNRVLMEIRLVEMELVHAGSEKIETLYHDCRDSDRSSGIASIAPSVGGQSISPVRAANGRPLYSASMIGSPPAPTYDAQLEKGHLGPLQSNAPRQLLNRSRHVPTSSWDSIADLISGTAQEANNSAPPAAPVVHAASYAGRDGGSSIQDHRRFTCPQASGSKNIQASQTGGVRLDS